MSETEHKRIATCCRLIEREAPDHPYLPIAWNRIRNAIKAGESAHRALEIARSWVGQDMTNVVAFRGKA